MFGGAYTWNGLFSEFYGIFRRENAMQREIRKILTFAKL